METNQYIDINKKTWNERTGVHVQSEFYNQAAFKAGKNSLNEIELSLLGDVRGKKILHLQCHFAQDTLSLARMGASAYGVDFSDEAIQVAKQTAEELQLHATFICCDLYELPQHLHEQFDIVFTSYGTIGWLPDIEKWADIVSQFLKPGGQFIFAEFHPAIWMYDDAITKITYSYFNAEPIIENENGTYAQKDAEIQTKCISWNHGLAEVIQALLNQQLQLQHFQEYNYSPYLVFPDMEEITPGHFQIKQFGNKMPLVYSLKMVKKGE
ncbi:MAG: class I SAM-dependent methyltransferase [Bacteroidetes bacterium]|nr:class I SAM-dependent methyltransferase [Bacteroidota bacterium]